MDFRKIILTFVLFSFLLIIPSAIGAVKTFHVQENDLVTISPEALDPDNDQVIYTFFPPLDKNGRWQTGYDDSGEYLLTIIAYDGKSKTKKEVLLIVDNKNQPPYLKEKKVTIKELQELDLKQFVADPDQDPLEYVFIAPLDKNGFWTPGYEDQGTFVVKFSVKDGEFIVPVRMEVEVLNTNQPPKIKNYFSEEKMISVEENERLSFYVEAEEGDEDPVSISWTLNGLPVSNKNTGEYFFNYDSAGNYQLVVFISDNQGHKVEEKWLITVEDVNRKPEVKLLPLTVNEGEDIKLKLPEKDADGDILTYTFDKYFDTFGNWQTSYEDAGNYNIKFYVSDGVDEVKETVEVTVLNVDRAPEFILPDKLEVKEGEKLSFVVKASDPDGEKVNLSFANAPEGALYDQKTSTFTWSPGYDYIKRRGGMFSNILNTLRLEQRLLRVKREALEIIACSQELCSSKKVPLSIYNSNRAPLLEIPSKLIITEAEVLQLQPKADDPDGDIVRYYFTAPAHKRKGNWETAYEDTGEYTIYVTATDGVNPQTLPVVVTVLQKNRQPTIMVPRDQYELQEGEELALSIEAFDYDNDMLSLSVENLPEGASFKNNTLIWKPGYNFVSSNNTPKISVLSEVSFLTESDVQREHWIGFVVSDNEFDVNHPVKLVVKDVNQKPEIKSFTPEEDVTLKLGQPFNFSVNAADIDEDGLTYAWTFEPGSEKLTGYNAVERTFVIPGEKKVTVVVSDGRSEASQEWKVKVLEEEIIFNPEVLALEEPPKFKVYVIEH